MSRTLAHWTTAIHHDTSALFVSNPQPKLGDTVEIRIRIPAAAPIHAVKLRSEPDGEAHTEDMHQSEEDGAFAWWEARLPITMPVNPYAFVIHSSHEGEFHYNALNVGRTRWPILFDFKLLADTPSPAWLSESVFYQIFPDRFHNGDPSLNVPDGKYVHYSGRQSETVAWDTPPRPYAQTGSMDFYGGDIPGIIQKLDYLQSVGVNALYLTPIFTSSSNHRYNVEDFYSVDPHLGGNDALIALRQALDARGMRLILDITTNHSGRDHVWFKAAQADPNAPSAEYYFFYRHPHDYAFWTIAPSLPKLNYQSAALRDKMYRADDSVMRHWLKPPFRADGWRVDVFNMTARHGAFQGQGEVAREMRHALKDQNPEAYFMGESFFDATAALQGDQLDAVMNYQGFTMPLWNWLASAGDPDQLHFDAAAFAEQARNFMAPIPYQIALNQFNMLGSHDTARIRHLVGGDGRLVKLAVALLMTFPGVPCIYYGDEIGMEGGRSPYNRAPMQWDDAQWDTDILAWVQRLIALRKGSSALKTGGYQTLYAQGGLLAFARHSPDQRLIVVAHRGPSPLPFIRIPVWTGGYADGVHLRDILGDHSATVRDGHITLPPLAVGAVLVLGE